MQMLHAGGFPTFGAWPAFEPQQVAVGRNMEALLPRLAGQAAKILDPRRSDWPKDFRARIVWLDRGLREQAKSQAKMMTMMAGIRVSGQTWRKIREQLIIDRELSLPLFDGLPMVRIRFEDTLKNPAKTADTLIEFLQADLDRQKMIDCVIKRPTRCAQGFEMEQYLVSFVYGKQPSEVA